MMKFTFLLFLFLSTFYLVGQETQTPRYVYLEVDTPAFYPGGSTAINAYLSSFHEELAQVFFSGTSLVVMLVIDDGGKIESVSTLNSSLSEEAMQLLERIFLFMPPWKPAIKQGKPVRSRLFLPLEF